VNLWPIRSLRRLRHPILTPLSAISLLCFLLTLTTWSAAALFPRSRFVVNWTDAGDYIDVSAEGFGWNRYGYYFQHTDNHYEGRMHVMPGAENSPVILQLAHQRRRALQSVRDSLTQLTPPNSHNVIWRANTPYLHNLLPNFLPMMSSSGTGEHHGFGGWVTLFSLLPILWLMVAAYGHHHRKHRRPPGSCPACGYDLHASPTRCPECGTPVQQFARVV
jgi:hypothetical protein